MLIRCPVCKGPGETVERHCDGAGCRWIRCLALMHLGPRVIDLRRHRGRLEIDRGR